MKFEDLTKGEIYSMDLHSIKYTFRFNYTKGGYAFGTYIAQSRYIANDSGILGSTDMINRKCRPASSEDIEHFRQCEKAEKYVNYKHLSYNAYEIF